MAKGDDIQERMIKFSVGILHCCDSIPHSQSGKHIAAQLLRAGTSPASNYSEARGAESSKDFVHKLGIVLKELNETKIWLKILEQREMISGNTTEILISECSELSRIINASIGTVRKKLSSSSPSDLIDN